MNSLTRRAVILAALVFPQIFLAQTPDQITQVDWVPNISGRWESLQWNLDIYVLELKATNKSLTGTVSMIPGPSHAESSPIKPVEIYDGKVEGNRFEFKVKSPDGMRIIRFTGAPDSGQLRVTRSVELVQPGASPGTDDIFGTRGPLSFVVKHQLPPTKRSRDIIQ